MSTPTHTLFTREARGDIAVFRLATGSTNYGHVALILEGVTRDGFLKVVLDFTDSQYVSSAAHDPLIRLHKHLAAGGGKLVLCNLCKNMLDAWNTTRFDTFFTIKGNLDAALAEF